MDPRPARPGVLRVAVISLAGSCVTTLALAANTGSLAGIVLDGGGAPLAGATVQITSDALIGGPQRSTSGEEGEFSFQLLPVGFYTAEARLDGYRAATGEVQVQSNHVGSVTFIMVSDTFAGTVDVTAEVPVVDSSQVNTGVVWDSEYLTKAGVGTANRYYQGVLAQAPGVSPGNNPTVFGGTYGENSYLIDGLNTTDPSFGTWSTMFNIDAVQEMSFQTGGFEAEFGQATGGIVNLVTKSGGNEFSGSFDARFYGERFTESGDHYDPEQNAEWRQQYAGTLGGPILRDRLWFFTSLQFINYTRSEAGTHFDREWEGWQWLAKATWQVAESSRLIAKAAGSPAAIPGVNSSRYVLESAKQTQEQGSDLWHLELDSVLSEELLLTAQAGVNQMYTRGFPTNNPDTLSGHWNEDTGLSYNNYEWFWDLPRNRNELRAAATWFVDDVVGSHQVKGGGDYSRVDEKSLEYLTGGGYVIDHSPSSLSWDPVDLNGDGYFNHYITTIEPADRTQDPTTSSSVISSLFLQDTWRPHPRLTVKPGVRWDRVVPTNHLGEQVADMARWQPRFGVAWDITGSARHVVRVSAGRFMDPTSLMIPWYNSGRESTVYHEYSTLEYYCNATRGLVCDEDSLPPAFGDPIHWTNWAGQGYTLIDNRGSGAPWTATTVDQAGVGRLRAPYSDELIVAYETQVAANSSVELSYVHKKSSDLIEDTCGGNAWAWGAAPYPSLDDPSTWTRADQCDDEAWMTVNMPGAEREYDAWIVRAEARRTWGHLMASYTYSDTRGTDYSGPQSYLYFAGDFFPVNFYNHEGKMPDHRWHRVKLNGYFLLPRRITLGVDAFWWSPGYDTVTSSCTAFQRAFGRRSMSDQMAALGIDPATLDYCTTPDGVFLGSRTLFLWPRGSLQTKSEWQVDVQLTKGFRVGKLDIEGILTVYNLFGLELDKTFNSTAFRQAADEDGNALVYQDDNPTAPYYDEYYGADASPVLVPIGEPLSYWDPRRYEIGVRIEF